MQIPGLVKIVVNMGVGEAARDAKLIDGAVRDLATDHRAEAARCAGRRKSIAQFKLREGMPIGAQVTLRGDRMWEFLDRLLSDRAAAYPRLPRPVDRRSSTGSGNYTFGLTEQSMFHEIDQDKIDRARGMDITVVTTATTDDEGRALLQAPRLPVQGEADDGEEGADPQGGRGSRSSRCARTPAASAAGARRRSTASSACAGSASARWRTAANCPASPSLLVDSPLPPQT